MPPFPAAKTRSTPSSRMANRALTASRDNCAVCGCPVLLWTIGTSRRAKSILDQHRRRISLGRRPEQCSSKIQARRTLAAGWPFRRHDRQRGPQYDRVSRNGNRASCAVLNCSASCVMLISTKGGQHYGRPFSLAGSPVTKILELFSCRFLAENIVAWSLLVSPGSGEHGRRSIGR